MNEIAKKVLLIGDKFIPDLHLRQLGFTYSGRGPFTKQRKRFKKIRERQVI